MKCVVIGAGFGGLTAAAELARTGFEVTVVEKNDRTGGRARVWEKDGFSFDMGPSWYLMPEVFDRFFARMGRNREDYYRINKLDPYYKIFFENNDPATVNGDFHKTRGLFESFEAGGGERLEKYLEQARYKYDIAMKEFLYTEYSSLFQFLNRRMLTEGLKLNVFSSIEKLASKYFSSLRAKQILEYGMVFLGTAPKDAPALYSIMSHVDLNLGVWYPDGGLAGAADGFRRLAEDLGAEIRTECEVTNIVIEKGRAAGVQCGDERIPADLVLSACDYQHSECSLLDKKYRSYPEKYWQKRTVAPSMFLIYMGIGRKLKSFDHHNLYFMNNWDDHFKTIFSEPSWPQKPCFYLSCNSKTDKDSAPAGCENVFILVPVAPGLEDPDEQRTEYTERVIGHIEEVTGENLHSDVIVARTYSHRDFLSDYHAFRGTALGLSHTLRQTAVFRPSHRSKKVSGLYYTGQYTHPGIGVPMAIIASEIAAHEIREDVG